MFQSTKFLTIILSILLVANTSNSFGMQQEPNIVTFYGKGIVEQSSPFAGEIVRTIVNGDSGLIMHSTPNGIVVVRLAVSESETCIQTISTICFDATVTNVRNTATHNVGDMINLTIDLENKKELISVISGPLQGSNITVDLTKTRTRDNDSFSYTLSREGGIVGISRIVTFDSSTKIMTIKNGPDESGPIMLDNAIINKFKNIIAKSGFFDMTTKEYPPTAGSADYFTYTLEITTKHFTNRIQWTDTSENVPEKLYGIRDKLQTTILSFLDENWTIVEPVRVARDFVISSPTFVFDGMEETLQMRLNSVVEISPPEYVIHARFDSRHGGYGDRTGQIVTQAIAPHLMEIVVSEGKVISAVIDGKWDEIAQTTIDESYSRQVMDYDGFIDNLRSIGATVKDSGNITQPFFSIKGHIILVNENEVQVFEYESIDEAKRDITLVSPDGKTIGTSIPSWIGTPHFYQKGKLIVLYVGDNLDTINKLEALVGPQFAGG